MGRLGKLCAVLFATALIAGCDVSDLGAMSLVESKDGEATPATLAVASAGLANGRITVSGPDGYCIDTSTMHNTFGGGFAAIASCNILSNGRSGPFVEPVLVTVTVGQHTGASPTPDDLASALETQLLRSRELSAAHVGLMATGGENAFAGSDAQHWRGAFILGDRLIGLALYAPKGSPLVGLQGAAFLNTVSSRIRARSEIPAAIAEQSQADLDPLEERLGRFFGSRDL